MAWHTVLISSFIVGITVYIISDISDSGGWVYVLILLLGASLVWPGFTAQLNTLSGNTSAPEKRGPGQTIY